MGGSGLVVLLSACVVPRHSIARLSDVTVADGVRNLAQTSDEAQSTNVGLFVGLLDNQSNYSNNSNVAAAIAEAGEVTSVAEDLMVVSAVTPGKRTLQSRLFRLFDGNANRAPLSRMGSYGTDIIAGAMLTFGEVARVCGLHTNYLGRQINIGGGF